MIYIYVFNYYSLIIIFIIIIISIFFFSYLFVSIFLFTLSTLLYLYHLSLYLYPLSKGGSILFPGWQIALAQDVVVVVVQYRLGALGFGTLSSFDVNQTNLGMQDQRLALQWTKSNIGLFGGDSSQVGCVVLKSIDLFIYL